MSWGEATEHTGEASITKTFTVPADAPNNARLPVSAFVVDKNGGLSQVITQEVTVKWEPKMMLKEGIAPVIIEDEENTQPDWKSFVDTKKTFGSVTNNAAAAVNWHIPGTYAVTYTATQETGDDEAPRQETVSADWQVIVKAKPLKLEQALVDGTQGDGPFTLSAKLTYPGPDPAANVRETSFVYSPTPNPTVGMAGYRTKATSAPMITKGQNVNVTLKKDTGLTPGLFYYARPYVRLADGKYIYGAQCSRSFYIQADGYGNFTVEAVAGTPGQFKVI